MKVFLGVLLITLCDVKAKDLWSQAVPGYQITLPKDNSPHYNFRTEWWYFTGNLHSKEGREFGYELTFFRYGYRPPDLPEMRSRFVMQDLKFAHFTVTEVASDRFRFDSRRSRGAFGEAGFAKGKTLAWIDDWKVDFDNDFSLVAQTKDYAIDLRLRPGKPPVLEGENGFSQKAEGIGHASYYYSNTRLETSGTITIAGKTYDVTGTSWYDREWATNQLGPEQEGWNWFAIQLDDGSDLMLYQMRLRNGNIDPHSSGKWIGPASEIIDFAVSDFRLTPTRFWLSSYSDSRYPIGWDLHIPKLDLELTVSTPVDNQELRLDFVYWEGLIRVRGTRNGRAVSGVGYLELTGYQRGAAGRAGAF